MQEYCSISLEYSSDLVFLIINKNVRDVCIEPLGMIILWLHFLWLIFLAKTVTLFPWLFVTLFPCWSNPMADELHAPKNYRSHGTPKLC